MTLAKKSKVKLGLWNLFINNFSLGLTYQVRTVTSASTIFKKSTFKKSNFKALESNYTLMSGGSRST